MEIINSIFEVFSAFTTWITSAITASMPVFYSAESGLTFIGSLAVCGLGMSVMFLVLGFIQNFLHFRG